MTSISRREFTARSASVLASALVPGARRTASRTAPRLIVRGDDMGYAHAGNEALIACHMNGIETTIELLVPSPWFPEAVRMLTEHDTVDVGVHLTLTSEWDMVKWRPLTAAPSLRDADGYFFPMLVPNPHYPGRSVSENAWRMEDVEREFRAQIELAKRHVPSISHVSGHMGCVEMLPGVKAMTRRLATEYSVDIWPEDHGVVPVGYKGPHVTSADKLDSFLRMLDALEDGRTYLFVDHPGLDTPELRAIHHIGYEQVAADRQGVTDMFTSSRAAERIKQRGIELIGYRNLRR